MLLKRLCNLKPLIVSSRTLHLALSRRSWLQIPEILKCKIAAKAFMRVVATLRECSAKTVMEGI